MGSLPPLAVLLVVCIRLTVPTVLGAQCPPLVAAGTHAGSASGQPFSCRFDAALTRMFTPRSVPKDTYRVYVTDASIETVVAAFRAVASSADVAGAWTVQAMDPLDGFGKAGPYDRAKLARVYLGVRARVAHGPMVGRGRTVASMTLVSPYPDVSLSRLERGTLIIEFRIPEAFAR
jgi:hypothetical protein